MQNLKTPAELQQSIEALIAELRALETSTLPAEVLAPLANSLKAACDYSGKIHVEIEKRAITDGIALPGVTVKPTVTHRKWNDAETAAELAFAQFGLKAFKLDSPAGIEKLGDEGKALVSVASFKPEAGKRVVY